MTTKNILLAIILVPLTVLLIAFIVANRQTVTLTLDPFSSDNLTFQAPLFVWLFVFFTLGILLGGIVGYLSRCQHRKASNSRQS